MTLITGSEIQIPAPEANRIRNSDVIAPEGSKLTMHPSALIENSKIIISPGGEAYIGKNTLIRGSRIEAHTGFFTIGSHCVFLESTARIRADAALAIGNCTRINPRNIFNVGEKIIIGDYCLFAVDCLIADNQIHSLDWRERRKEIDSWITQNPLPLSSFDNLRTRPLIIESDCWINKNVNILVAKEDASELRIGSKSVVGAGAVVKESIPQLSVAVGVPAKVIYRLE